MGMNVWLYTFLSGHWKIKLGELKIEARNSWDMLVFYMSALKWLRDGSSSGLGLDL